MPIKQSAKKHLRASNRRQYRNLRAKRKMRHVTREVRDFASVGKKDEAQKSLSKAYKTLDKAAKSGVIHKNRANRTKSRLSKVVKKSGEAKKK